jgi:hypothetical protein
MTDKLNEAKFDGWVHTGSLTTSCLRFKHEMRGFIYALRTVHEEVTVDNFKEK